MGRQGPFVPHPHTASGFSWGELTPPRCLETCPGQLQSPWGPHCSDLCPAVGAVGGGAQPQAWAMEGRVGRLPKACEECLRRSLKLKSLVSRSRVGIRAGRQLEPWN